MFRSDDRRKCAPHHSTHHCGATAVLAALIATLALVPVAAIGEEGSGQPPPAAGSPPNAAPGEPGVVRPPGGGNGGELGEPGQDGAQQPDSSPGCPFRDRPLNLLV
ncbi:MAG: hypothetical protein KJ622_05495 [Alphaproteobacteria bacterium]|nr:hypothetical protein [Alphaproteobacteria bacterium]